MQDGDGGEAAQTVGRAGSRAALASCIATLAVTRLVIEASRAGRQTLFQRELEVE